jgi:hypothetical protein
VADKAGASRPHPAIDKTVAYSLQFNCSIVGTSSKEGVDGRDRCGSVFGDALRWRPY